MQNVLVTLNAAPYGDERALNALRYSLALAGHDSKPAVTLFLLSDAVGLAKRGQRVAAGATLESMLQDLLELGGTVKACRTCVDARGFTQDEFVEGVGIGTMPELAGATLAADKVMSF